ncbi:MAG: DUF2953 domain-containing protein [Bacillota bacterium]
MWFLIALLTAAVAGLLIGFSRLTLRVEYTRQGIDDHLSLEAAAFWGLLRYRLNVPVLGINPSFEGAPGVKIKIAEGERPGVRVYFAGFAAIYRLLRRLAAFYSRYRDAVHYLWRRLRIIRFEWHTTVGTGEPASTGAVCGLLWGIKGYVLGRITPLLEAPGSISLNPDFKSPAFGTLISLTAFVQLRHLFTAGFYVFRCLNKK